MASDGNSLAHTKWNCKYHIVFAPKYRRKVIYGKMTGIHPGASPGPAPFGASEASLGVFTRLSQQKCPCKQAFLLSRIKADIGKILRKLCEWKGVEILEAEACPDHIHLLLTIPPKISVSSFMGYLKGKSSLMIFDQHANLKYKYGNREFWCRGYYVDTVGKNKKAIAEYIRNQLQEDLAYEQMSIKELVDPFTGEPVKKSNK